jgi:hypothetical protein
MRVLKRMLAFLLLIAAGSCIEPYIPNLRNYKSLLVVEGLISNEESSYRIKLGRTFYEQKAGPEMVTDADVFITDGDGIRTDLRNGGDGYYRTDSTSFRGVIGQKYTLEILTSDGKKYRSEECTMLPVSGIDKLYYEKGEKISGNNGETFTGLRIRVKSADSEGEDQYFRWTFEEVWKTIMPGYQKYTYTKIDDSTCTFRGVPSGKEICWKRNRSGDIITNSYTSGEGIFIPDQEIQFISPVLSDRLTQEYSILVKQYSISNNEYDFWRNLKKVGDAGGDIFASQPYTVISNIHNVNNADELVLGYFEVSAVSQKRIFITASELDPLLLPHYKTDCVLIAMSPLDYPPPRPTWDGLYHMFMDIDRYTFVGPIVVDGTILEGSVNIRNLVKFVFSTKACALCDYVGFTTKPDFWFDSK